MASNIQYQLVTSSNIHAVARSKDITYIEFKGGRRFSWGQVPQAVYDDMLAAKSIGTFFARNIKGKFPVAWNGWRCNLSPCSEDATVSGMVSMTRIHLCGECAKAPRFYGIALTPIQKEE